MRQTRAHAARYLLPMAGATLLGFAFYLDAGVQQWMAAHQTPAMRDFMGAVSRWGDWLSHVVLGFCLAGGAYLLNRPRWVRIFLAMLIACAIAGSVNRVVKIAAGRSRPDVEIDAGWRTLRFSSKYNAFPSGHTAASTAFFATLVFAAGRVAVPLLVIPLLVAFSRMYLGAHYFSDVVGGALIALLAAWLVARWLSRSIENRKSKIEN